MRKATPKEIPEIRSLWQDMFGDSEDYISRFIVHFGIENCYVCEINHDIAAMAFAIPVETERAQSLPLWYIYACATRPQYRN
jgi:hypothetical protein